jgi:serine/threonine-protein kinase
MRKIPSVAVRQGEVLDGKYRVERLLGCGGMGAVVRARHLQLDVEVAVKIMTLNAMNDPSATARFAREVRAAARLRSEHAARVLDVGKTQHGAPYMVMEYLDGVDFGQLLRANKMLPVHVAVDYILQACEAVAEAHSLGIIHRDLKPRNLFLTKAVDGRALVKVVDFGIAKQRTTANGSITALTKTTALIGSPEYMAPEQMSAPRDVDARSDIYSLGVTLYELLSGALPHESDNIASLLARVMMDSPVPLSSVAPHVPQPLAEAVMRCLVKDRNARFPNVAELAAALEPYGASQKPSSADRVYAVLGETPRPSTTTARLPPSMPPVPAAPPAPAPPAAPVIPTPLAVVVSVPPPPTAPAAAPTPVPPARPSSSGQLAFSDVGADTRMLETWITRRRRPHLRVAAALAAISAGIAIAIGVATSASSDERPRAAAGAVAREVRVEEPSLESLDLNRLARSGSPTQGCAAGSRCSRARAGRSGALDP